MTYNDRFPGRNPLPRLPVLVALAAAVLAAPASAAAQKKPRVAITDLRALGT
jgi:hypothetical protein